MEPATRYVARQIRACCEPIGKCEGKQFRIGHDASSKSDDQILELRNLELPSAARERLQFELTAPECISTILAMIRGWICVLLQATTSPIYTALDGDYPSRRKCQANGS